MLSRVLGLSGFGFVFALLAACGGGGSKNHDPVLTAASLTGTEDTVLTGQLSATDEDGDPVTFARATAATHGTVTVSASGAVSYTPNANYAGTDSFTVTVSDDDGGTSTGTVNITLAGVNDAPDFTSPTQLAINEDVPLNTQLAASDPDGNPLTFTIVAAAAHGAAVVSATGAVTYTPSPNYFGPDTFTARVTDGAGGEDTHVLTITIAPVNDPPVVTSTQFAAVEDTLLSAQLTGSDVEGVALTFRVSSAPAHGAAAVSAGGQLDYTPAPNYTGADTVTVGVSDGGGTFVDYPVAISVAAVNDAPVATDDEIRVAASAVVTFGVTANDVDVDGDTLVVELLDAPGGGLAEVTAQNQIRFTRDNDFQGPLRFRYRVTDAAGVTAEATVRAVVGDFAGLYYLSDETTLGVAELHYFDGITVSRISGALAAGESVPAFSLSGNRSSVAFVVDNPIADRVYVTDSQGTPPRLVYTSSPKNGNGTTLTQILMNRNGSWLQLVDPHRVSRPRSSVVRVSDGAELPIGANEPNVMGLGYFAWSPADDDFYTQGQVGGSATMSGTGFLTMLAGTSTDARLLAQIGSSYPAPSGGAGSGFEPRVTANGRYVVYQELLFGPVRSSVLVYDTLLGVEAPIYQRPGANQIGMWDGFALSNDGNRVCFQFREADGGGSFGPSRFVVGNPGAPASAVPVTPVTAGGFTCQFGSDNRTLLYLAHTVATPTMQMFSVDSAAPGTPALVNRPLVGAESLQKSWVARDAMRAVFATSTAPALWDYYSVSLDAPGTFIPFASNTFDDGSRPGQLDAQGRMLAYSRRPMIGAGVRRLTLLSTQSNGYVVTLTRPDSTTGVVQFEWAQ